MLSSFGSLREIEKLLAQPFAGHLQRVVGAKGVEVLGLHYHSIELQKHLFRVGHGVGDRVVDVCVNRFDLGQVMVLIDGKWCKAPCVRSGFKGVSITARLSNKEPRWMRFR